LFFDATELALRSAWDRVRNGDVIYTGGAVSGGEGKCPAVTENAAHDNDGQLQ